MLRSWPVNELKSIARYVNPMVWGYVADLSKYRNFPKSLWKRYSQAFRSLWVASSFKGALKAWSNFVPTKQHMENHLSWLKIINELQKSKVTVTGIALTGWSRFDHYGPMCELLPAGIPTLALCLEIIKAGEFNHDIHLKVSQMLGFSEDFNLNVDYFKKYTPEKAIYIGSDVYILVGQLEHALGYHNWGATRVTGWNRPFQIRKGQVSYYHLNASLHANEVSLKKLVTLKDSSREILSKYFDDATVDEWILDKIDYSITEVNSTIQELRTGIRSIKT